MSFEIAPVGANAVNTRPDIALLQANATSALAKISGDVKSANVAQVAPTNPPAGLVSSLAATQTAITSTQNAVNVLQTADAAYAKGVTLAQQGVIALLQLDDEVMAVGGAGSRLDLFLTQIAPHGDVVAHTAGEQKRVLRNQAHIGAEVRVAET